MTPRVRNRLVGASACATLAILAAWSASSELLAATSTAPTVRLLAARKAGTLTERPVSVSSASGTFSALDLEVSYTATSAAPTIKATGDASGASVTTNKRAAGVLAIVLASPKPLPNGVVLVIQYPAGTNPQVRLSRAAVDEKVVKLP